MHTALTILAGLLRLGVFLIFGWLWGGSGGIPAAARLFVPAWVAVAVANLRVGVTRAGYTVAQELPILAVNLAVRAIVAPALAWRPARG